MDFFPDVSNHSNQILFEKSANYFDAVKGPMRVSALLPNAKIITIFIDPMKRAYSWYQVSVKYYPFIAQERLTCNFSQYYIYIDIQTGNENTQIYQVEVVILI